MITITEYSKGYLDGYYKATYSVYQALKASSAARSSPNIMSPIQGILDGLEIILKDYSEPTATVHPESYHRAG